MHLKETEYEQYKQDSSGTGYGPKAGSYECGNEPLGPKKGQEFLD
jgi:hypothetical protein